MRILFSVLGYKPAYRVGGSVFAVTALAEKLVERGHQVVVFTSNSNSDEDLEVPTDQPVSVSGVEVWYFQHKDPLKKYLPFVPYLSQSIGYLYLPALQKVLNQKIQEFDLIHTHTPFMYPTWAIARMGIKYNIPLFYHQHGVFAPNYLRFRGLKKHIYISLFEKPIMEKAAFLLALTEAEVESYRDLGATTPCRIVPNGIDARLYCQKADPEFRVKDDFFIRENDTVILFLARLHTIKGADFLLDVFLQIYNKYPNLKLILAGPDQHNIQEKLEMKIALAGIKNRVCIPGMVIGDLKNKLLARADLFCLPSLAEGFSISILEAMASTTPVLITPECNFSSLETESAGWIVERNQQKWVEKISYLLENNSELLSAGKNSFNLVNKRYTWDIAVDRLEEVYAEGLQRMGVNGKSSAGR
jgi:glycosyltransferase involved in cell wall biosynthesis